MLNYEFKFIDEAMKAEMQELMNGEHGKTLEEWTAECINFGIERYKYHERVGMFEGSLFVIAGVGLLTGGVYLGRKIARRIDEKKNKKPVEVIEV